VRLLPSGTGVRPAPGPPGTLLVDGLRPLAHARRIPLADGRALVLHAGELSAPRDVADAIARYVDVSREQLASVPLADMRPSTSQLDPFNEPVRRALDAVAYSYGGDGAYVTTRRLDVFVRRASPEAPASGVTTLALTDRTGATLELELGARDDTEPEAELRRLVSVLVGPSP
jgi:hypothetical protein